MADEHHSKIDFSFLSEEAVQNHFADLNIELLKGAHIQKDAFYLFSLLQDKERDLQHYYISLYGLELTRGANGNETYYYLDFTEQGKGKLSKQERYRELSTLNIVMGILLLKMYYDKYFDFQKIIHWTDIEQQINDSENSTNLKSMFFEEQREFYSEAEWLQVKKRIGNCLKEFEVLGWITRIPSQSQETLSFSIKESIHRFAKLYENELVHFDEFVNAYQKQSGK
ncbi:chromosome partition protein MukE [Flavobacterium sp. CAN_S2]|uniref:chromosome partition protein MukE n=1 Tax=Flavobacterium sp. CAN_S2 TaxID=2787726 RepID=UPI0018CBC496